MEIKTDLKLSPTLVQPRSEGPWVLFASVRLVGYSLIPMVFIGMRLITLMRY